MLSLSFILLQCDGWIGRAAASRDCYGRRRCLVSEFEGREVVSPSCTTSIGDANFWISIRAAVNVELCPRSSGGISQPDSEVVIRGPAATAGLKGERRIAVAASDVEVDVVSGVRIT